MQILQTDYEIVKVCRRQLHNFLSSGCVGETKWKQWRRQKNDALHTTIEKEKGTMYFF